MLYGFSRYLSIYVVSFSIYFFKGWTQLELYFNQMQRTEHTFINL